MYTHFIWDFDGTLFDTYPLILTLHRQVLLSFGIKEDMTIILKMLKEHDSEYVIKYYDEKYNISKEEFSKSYSNLENKNEYIKLSKPFEDVVNICRYIKSKGYKNYIISNRNSSIKKFLCDDNVCDFFDDIIVYTDGFKRKPSSEMFEHLIQKHNLNVVEVLSIGDRNIDLIASTKVGIGTCLYRPYSGKFDYEPKYIIKDMKELYDIIDGKK